MARWRVEPTQLDRRVAAGIARHATPALERPAKIMTLAADERLLLTVATGLWLVSCGTARRRKADHLAAVVALSTIIPHLCKHLVAQKRPDRAMIHGERHGVPRSGEPYDAFPSGHAMHVGAIASALSRFSPAASSAIWTVGGIIAATRVVLLAHWMSDVLVGLAAGIGLEHLIWRLWRAPQRLRRSVLAGRSDVACDKD